MNDETDKSNQPTAETPESPESEAVSEAEPTVFDTIESQEQAGQSEFTEPADIFALDFSGIADLTDLLQAEEVITVADAPEVEGKVAMRFAVIGAGQGGCRIANGFWERGYRRVVLINTTDKDWPDLAVPRENRLLMEGWDGAGKDPVIGQIAVRKYSEEIFNLCRDKWGPKIDRVFICIGGGGGTGTGACTALIAMAHGFLEAQGVNDFERKVGVIVTAPPKDESHTTHDNANRLLNELTLLSTAGKISPLMIVDNEKLSRTFRSKLSTHMYWKTVNDIFIATLHTFNYSAGRESPYTTLDAADLDRIMSSGLMVFGSTRLKHFNTAVEIADGVRKNIQYTIFKDNYRLETAKEAGAVIIGDVKTFKELPQGHIDEAYETLKRTVGGKATVHRGQLIGPSAGLFLHSIVGGMTQ